MVILSLTLLSITGEKSYNIDDNNATAHTNITISLQEKSHHLTIIPIAHTTIAKRYIYLYQYTTIIKLLQ